MDAARSVVSTNDVILNRSCRDMRVEASYMQMVCIRLELDLNPELTISFMMT